MMDSNSQNLFGVEYEPAYSEIEGLLSQLDDVSDPLSRHQEPPQINWHHISELANGLLEQCFDLRVALWQIRANIHRKGVSALYEGVRKIDALINDTNTPVYPQSETPPHNSGHAAALGWLSTPQCIAELKAMRLTPEHTYTLQDLITIDTAMNEPQRHLATSATLLLTVNNYFQQNGIPVLEDQLSQVEKITQDLESSVNQHSEGYQLNCKSLYQFLKSCQSELLTLNIPSVPIQSEMASEDEIHQPQNNAPGIPGDKNIHSRQDIIFLLDRILDYYQKYEPSHPAPILIRRTKDMIGMDFYSIIEDLLPESLAALKQFTGKH